MHDRNLRVLLIEDIAIYRQLIRSQLERSAAGAIELEAMTQALLMTTADHAEFLASFREKRDPDWTGR